MLSSCASITFSRPSSAPDDPPSLTPVAGCATPPGGPGAGAGGEAPERGPPTLAPAAPGGEDDGERPPPFTPSTVDVDAIKVLEN